MAGGPNPLLLASVLLASAVATALNLRGRRRSRGGLGTPLPSEGGCVYLDYAATCPIYPEVADAMVPFLYDHWGNPSSGHAYGAPCRSAAVGKIDVNAKRLGVDYLTLVGHKFGAPKGVAALYHRRGAAAVHALRRRPGGRPPRGHGGRAERRRPRRGGGHLDPRGRRDRPRTRGDARPLRRRLEAALGPERCAVNGPLGAGGEALPNVLSFAVRGAARAPPRGAGVASPRLASAACHSGSDAVSAVLLAVGVETELALGTLRLSRCNFIEPPTDVATLKSPVIPASATPFSEAGDDASRAERYDEVGDDGVAGRATRRRASHSASDAESYDVESRSASEGSYDVHVSDADMDAVVGAYEEARARAETMTE
ncbi:cysteine desulfurase [Aureococcus anophagefferens]|uniref:Cysteine desulfurase n=1 Tax=Aureococcus anophagefferens TaxID=44056 RepID=A0ABR1FWJ4_AURAN